MPVPNYCCQFKTFFPQNKNEVGWDSLTQTVDLATFNYDVTHTQLRLDAAKSRVKNTEHKIQKQND